MPAREFLCQSNGTASPSDINEANKSTALSAQLHRQQVGLRFSLLSPPLPSLCVKILHRTTKALQWRPAPGQAANIVQRRSLQSRKMETGAKRSQTRAAFSRAERGLCPPGATGPQRASAWHDLLADEASRPSSTLPCRRQPRRTERRGEKVALLHAAKSGRARECHTGWGSGSKAQPAKVQDWRLFHAASSQYFCKPCHAWNVLRFQLFKSQPLGND